MGTGLRAGPAPVPARAGTHQNSLHAPVQQDTAELISPVVTTDATRTIETAEILLGVLGPLPVLSRYVDPDGGFNGSAKFAEKLAEWAATSDKLVAPLAYSVSASDT